MCVVCIWPRDAQPAPTIVSHKTNGPTISPSHQSQHTVFRHGERFPAEFPQPKSRSWAIGSSPSRRIHLEKIYGLLFDRPPSLQGEHGGGQSRLGLTATSCCPCTGFRSGFSGDILRSSESDVLLRACVCLVRVCCMCGGATSCWRLCTRWLREDPAKCAERLALFALTIC